MIKMNKGWFKTQGKLTSANCLVCKKSFVHYASTHAGKYCSPQCYHTSRKGKSRPRHSDFMKEFCKTHDTTTGLIGRVQSKQERENTSTRMLERWKDKNDYLNSGKYRQSISDRNVELGKLGIGVSTYNKGFARGRQGTYDINGRSIFFRSSWEANYALYLDFLIKQGQVRSWEFEADTFWFEAIRRGVRSYKPDFKVVTDTGKVEYHEVKGWMDQKSRTKIQRMAKYYPDVKLIVVDQEAYRDISRKIGRMLGFY